MTTGPTNLDQILVDAQYIICKRPNEAETKMVQCNLCLRWYYFTCAGVGDSIGAGVVSYQCVLCAPHDAVRALSSTRSASSTTVNAREAKLQLEMQRLAEEKELQAKLITEKAKQEAELQEKALRVEKEKRDKAIADLMTLEIEFLDRKFRLLHAQLEADNQASVCGSDVFEDMDKVCSWINNHPATLSAKTGEIISTGLTSADRGQIMQTDPISMATMEQCSTSVPRITSNEVSSYPAITRQSIPEPSDCAISPIHTAHQDGLDGVVKKRNVLPSFLQSPRTSQVLTGDMPATQSAMMIPLVINKAMSTAIATMLDCSREVCTGNIITPSVVGTEPRKPDIVLQHAKDFLDCSLIRRLKSLAHYARWHEVQKKVETSGSYNLTKAELTYGARLAWCNSFRCIGRIQWSKLQVFDCRYITTTSVMFGSICNHIKYVSNKGNLRSAITIFQQRMNGKHDYRIGNAQIMLYAGYKGRDGTIIGDPIKVEFTDFCIKLRWKSKGIEWDILSLVVSANGHNHDYFDYPPELILEVPLSHHQYKWYVMPAVSDMLFDCGGIQFTATTFSGLNMSTDINCRNLCDTNLKNLLEPIVVKINLGTRNPTSLWKGKSMVEMNIAVLHSLQSRNIIIVDHHTANKSFMKYHENETKLRNGCPADWVWFVPPMYASATSIHHQKIVLYYLRPSFEYHETSMKTHNWKKRRDSCKNKKLRRKFYFKRIVRAVKFKSKFFGHALSGRINATALHATETGRSEQYAKQLVELLGHAFNAQVYCMSDYDISSMEHEAMQLVVAPTFGNGDPPENGDLFVQDLYAMKLHKRGHNPAHSELSTAAFSKFFIKANSQSDMNKHIYANRKNKRLDFLRGSTTDTLSEKTFDPLSNVWFTMCDLGFAAYPNFYAYRKYIDSILVEMAGERMTKMTSGDEIVGPEHVFRKWELGVFKIPCDMFCLDQEETYSDAAFSLQSELTENVARFARVSKYELLAKCLSKFHNKKVTECTLKRKTVNVHEWSNARERSAILVKIITEEMAYEPGDHVGILPANRTEIVDGVIDADEARKLQVLVQKRTQNGVYKSWDSTNGNIFQSSPVNPRGLAMPRKFL